MIVYFYLGQHERFNNSILLLEMEQLKLTGIHLRHVTRLDLGLHFDRTTGKYKFSSPNNQ